MEYQQNIFILLDIKQCWKGTDTMSSDSSSDLSCGCCTNCVNLFCCLLIGLPIWGIIYLRDGGTTYIGALFIAIPVIIIAIIGYFIFRSVKKEDTEDTQTAGFPSSGGWEFSKSGAAPSGTSMPTIAPPMSTSSISPTSNEKIAMREIEAEIEQARKTIHIIEPEDTIYRPNVPTEGPKILGSPPRKILDEVSEKLLKSIDEVADSAHKLIFVYDNQLMYVKSYLSYFNENIRPIPYINMMSVIMAVAETKEIDTTPPKSTKSIEDMRQTVSRQMMKESENFKVVFPFDVVSPLTIDECKKFIVDEMVKSINEKYIPENNRSIIAVYDFDWLLSGTHLFPDAENTFLEAFFELSKDFVFILADPRNSYARNSPAFLALQKSHMILMGSEQTPLNTASLSTFPILRKMLSSAKLVKSGR